MNDALVSCQTCQVGHAEVIAKLRSVNHREIWLICDVVGVRLCVDIRAAEIRFYYESRPWASPPLSYSKDDAVKRLSVEAMKRIKRLGISNFSDISVLDKSGCKMLVITSENLRYAEICEKNKKNFSIPKLFVPACGGSIAFRRSPNGARLKIISPLGMDQSEFLKEADVVSWIAAVQQTLVR